MNSHDMDRRLDDFFADGAGRAPDRTIEAAIAHARAHPRRRDPLRALRRDPMAAPWFGGSPMARGLVLAAVLATLVAASFAVASVGGIFDRPAVIVPGPTPSPSASPSPSVAPSPTARTLRVDLVEVVGADASVEITDASGTLADARSGQPADGGSVATGTVDVTAVDDRSVALTWTGLPCASAHTLVIEGDGRTMTLGQPTCEGDTIPRDLVVVLVFAEPVTPASLDVSLVPATQP